MVLEASGIVIFVVTGGPGHGKDYLIGLLAQDPWFMENALFFDESAAWTITGHAMTREEFGCEDTRNAFQQTVAAAGMLKYRLAIQRAIRLGRKFVFLNRHILDGVAYVSGVDFLELLSGYSAREMIQDVTHVVWCGPPPEQYYQNSEYRFESYAHAVALGQSVLVQYRQYHPSVHEVHGTEDPAQKYRALRAKLHELESEIPELVI